MDTPFTEGLSLAIVLPLMLIGADITRRVATYLRGESRRRCITHITRLLLQHDEPDEMEILARLAQFSRPRLIESLCYIAAHIYGEERLRIATIVEVCALEKRLIRSAKRSNAEQRERHLAKLAQLPITANCFEDIEEFIERQESIYALITIIDSRPERAIRYCTRLHRQLSHYEVAIIADSLRRGGAPVAYTPLLHSENENLQLIGIHLVEQLTMIDAEAQLQRLLASSNLTIATHALRTLCTIHGELPLRRVATLTTRMTPSQRDSFVRHAIQSCYSPRSCASALNSEEQRLFTAKIDSYKCRILCN